MRFLSKLFGNKDEGNIRSGDEATIPKFERRMKEVFGLEYNEKGPLYIGYCDDNPLQISSAKDCMQYVKTLKLKFKDKGLIISDMCVVPSSAFTTIIFNTSPNTFAFNTSLSIKEAATLIADIIMINKKSTKTYKGTYIVPLEGL